MSAAQWMGVLSIALLAGCATGADTEEDGVIKGRADTRNDTASEEDTDVEEDTATEEDTGTQADSGSSTETSVTDTGSSSEDTGSSSGDTGSSSGDTGSTDTGPTSCAAEEAEPNDTPATARSLKNIDDCDGSGGSIGGVLSSESDVDVLTFDGTDTFGCSVNPYIKVTGPARVCMKVACKSGTTEFKGCPKGTVTGSECCSTSELELDFNCTGTTSEDAKVTITVRGSGASLMCAGYSLAYHY